MILCTANNARICIFVRTSNVNCNGDCGAKRVFVVSHAIHARRRPVLIRVQHCIYLLVSVVSSR